MSLTPIKLMVLEKLCTFMDMESSGYKDYSVMLCAYEWSLAGLAVEKGVIKDASICDRWHDLLGRFWRKAVDFDGGRFGYDMLDEREMAEFRHNFNHYVALNLMDDVFVMDSVISLFLHKDRDITIEQLRAQTRADVDFDRGAFMIDASYV